MPLNKYEILHTVAQIVNQPDESHVTKMWQSRDYLPSEKNARETSRYPGLTVEGGFDSGIRWPARGNYTRTGTVADCAGVVTAISAADFTTISAASRAWVSPSLWMAAAPAAIDAAASKALIRMVSLLTFIAGFICALLLFEPSSCCVLLRCRHFIRGHRQRSIQKRQNAPNAD